MKDPERLLQHGATPSELVLLRAANEEEPSETAREQLWTVLGLGATSLLPAASGVVPVAKGTAGAAAKAAASATGMKWLMASVAAVVVAGGALSVGARAGGRAPEVVPSAKPAEARTPMAPVETGTPAPEVVAPPVVALGLSARTAPAQGVKPEAPQAANSIADEISKLDEIRRLLDGGKTGKASGLLDAYTRKYPGGALGQEARFLRIEVLAKSGNPARARELGERFLRENPASPHASRIRSLLTDAP